MLPERMQPAYLGGQFFCFCGLIGYQLVIASGSRNVETIFIIGHHANTAKHFHRHFHRCFHHFQPAAGNIAVFAIIESGDHFVF